MAERSKAAVLKTAVGQPTRGSNPFFSANYTGTLMDSLLDAFNWDSDRIQQEIASRLPVGWDFKLQPNHTVNRWEALVFDTEGKQGC